jgi:hypothetical protein
MEQGGHSTCGRFYSFVWKRKPKSSLRDGVFYSCDKGVMSAEQYSVSSRVTYIVLRGRSCLIVLNAHVPTEDDSKCLFLG